MVVGTSLVLLSAMAVSTLCSPRPDEGSYRIPQVGTGRRSQYYVLHSDGTYKYGHDTGEGAFEEARSSRVGEQRGAFGYVDPDGKRIRLQYEAGEGGFVPQGAHLPSTHPDFNAAHARARGRPPFVDPLANAQGDASYGFQFAEEGQARSEESDAEGNVRGSYSYTDDQGRTRTYSYTAGKGTGFVVQGNDLPTAPQDPSATPAATRLSGRPSTSFRGTSLRGTSSLIAVSPSTRSGGSPAGFSSPSSAVRPSHSSLTRPLSSLGYSSGRPYEEADTNSQLSRDGGYSLSYRTSSHSRQESGDANNNVDGNFAFVADDGQRRAIQYEAGSDTGFIAQGSHIPVGPKVPGAPTGQPTGRILPVKETPFVDPLANPNADASYSFAFDSDQYSRSETSDAQGNVRGTYTLRDDEGRRRTYRFRAGEGVGFEKEEVSAPGGLSPSQSPSSSASGVTTYSSRPSSSSRLGHSSSSSFSPSSFSPSAPSGGFRSASGAGFQLRQYDATKNPHKFGYVLTYDN